ncbi:MAG: AAA family ATPase, partial [Planctomycetota bacterium]|nr:AAA family ATPase [Planctomycetota bacterium]
FLMELPRDQMELIEPEYYEMPEYEVSENSLADPEVYVHREPVEVGDVAAARLTTAAEMMQHSGPDAAAAEASAAALQVDAETFRVGMAVMHPDYGLGKIAALSGSGAKRTATVNFALSGRRTFRIKESPLRPAGVTS